MTKAGDNPDELRPEYQREDFGQMVRGKYAKQVRESSNIVVLDPDIAAAFPNSQCVNETLRKLLELARSSAHLSSGNRGIIERRNMKAYHFNTTVEADGSIHLSGLPPETEVEIVVTERGDLAAEMEQWMSDIRTRHPFAKMSKEEILQILRETREAVSAERNAS